MKSIKYLVLIASILVGCKSLSYQPEEPTASSEKIKNAQEYFSQPEFEKYVSVSDEGVITYIERVPPGYRWDKVSIIEAAYKISCKSLRTLLEDGFTTVIDMQGKGGTYMKYDRARCLEEDLARLER